MALNLLKGLIIVIINILFITTNTLVSNSIEKPNTCFGKTVIKSVEKIVIIGTKYKKTIKARIDTGANYSSIDTALAKTIGFKNIVSQTKIRNAQGEVQRSVIKLSFILKEKKIESFFSLANRQKLSYLVLIGREELKGFLIEPSE